MKDNYSRIKKIIEQQVIKILSEAEAEPAASAPQSAPKADDAEKKKNPEIKRGAIGRGSIKDRITKATAKAASNPKQLMQDLNVKNAPSGNTIQEKVLSVVRSAIYGTEDMREAYLGATIRDDKVYITPRGLSARDGTLYMLNVLTAAENLNMLGSYDNQIVVSRDGDQGIEIKFD